MGAAVALGLSAVLLLAGCRPDTVDLAFRPAVGARYEYEVRVRSVTTTRLAGAAPRRSVDATVLSATQVVRSAGPDGVRVQVQLRRRGSPPRNFDVRFDRAAQLEALETVEGLPASVLGRLDLPEVFPGATGGPPDRRLAPGERWHTDAPLRLPDGRQTRVQGDGRLVELGIRHGRKVASTVTRTRLPLTAVSDAREGRLSLDGVEVTGVNAARDLADGSVMDASSTTRGTFRLLLSPPAGSAGAPVDGTLDVEVQSRTRRLG